MKYFSANKKLFFMKQYFNFFCIFYIFIIILLSINTEGVP
jgi:hypothetical protein